MSDFNPFNENSANFERELIPEGPHAARCARVIEIGVQSSPLYGDKNKAVIALSIPGVTLNINGEEKQRFISNPFGIPISSNERSTMRQYARALCPKGGNNMGDFLGKPCQIVVRHRTKGDRTLDILDSVAPIIPGIEVPELDTEPFWFKWNDPDEELWGLIPEFTKKLIREAANYPGSYVEEVDKEWEQNHDVSEDEPTI